MLEDVEQKKQEIEKEREELTLGGSLFLYQVKWKEGCFVCVRHDQWFWSTSIFSINVSLCFASGSEETLFQMHSHYCTLVGDSCRDSGRVLAKRIKDTSTSSMAQYGTCWLILRKRRIQMLESAEHEKNILEREKQDLTLGSKVSSNRVDVCLSCCQKA